MSHARMTTLLVSIFSLLGRSPGRGIVLPLALALALASVLALALVLASEGALKFLCDEQSAVRRAFLSL